MPQGTVDSNTQLNLSEPAAGSEPTELDDVRRTGVTQIFLGTRVKRQLSFLALGDFVIRVLRLAPDIQVTVVAHQRAER